MRLDIRQARASDIDALAGRLRREDEQEVITAGYPTSREALQDSFNRSTFCFCVDIEGAPAALWGIAPESYLGERASVWFLGTPEMAKAKKSFVRHSRDFIDFALTFYPTLVNMVDSRYTSSVRWLKVIGAVFLDPPIRINGVDFLPFIFRRA